MRIQVVSRWATCIVPSPKLTMRWILRSRTDSKSFCIRVPATVTTIPKGSAPPAPPLAPPPLSAGPAHPPPRRAGHQRAGDLGDGLVGQHREPGLHGPGRDGQGKVVPGTQGADEGPDALSARGKHGPRLAAAEASEGRDSPDPADPGR